MANSDNVDIKPWHCSHKREKCDCGLCSSCQKKCQCPCFLRTPPPARRSSRHSQVPSQVEENRGKVLANDFHSFLWCKNIQDIEWYNLRDHRMTLSGYIPGKWRKVVFLKKSEHNSFLTFKKSFLKYAVYDEFGPKK